MAASDKKQMTLRIPLDVHKKFRILAALNDKTMTDYFISLVDDAYKKHSGTSGPTQLKLPTS